MGADDQIVVLDDEVVNSDGGQIQLELLPGGAVVGRNLQSQLGTRVEQAFVFWIFAHGMQGLILGKLGGEGMPGIAEVSCLEKVRMIVSQTMRIDADEGCPGVEWRSLNTGDRAPLRDAVDILRDIL